MMNPSEAPAMRGKKILIIEDDELIASVYKRHFELACFEVQVELNGSEGYYRIYRFRPDAVLLDLLLPGMDGPSIIRKFRVQKEFTGLPIIVFTNAYLDEIGRDAASAGATEVFNKATATPQEIVKAVVEALSRKQEEPLEPVEAGESPEENRMFRLTEEEAFHSGADSLKPDTVGEIEARPPSDAARRDAIDDEMAFRSEVRKKFLQKSAVRIDGLREIVRLLKVDAGRAPKEEVFVEMARIARAISGGASLVGLDQLAHLAAALEAFAWELCECPTQFSAPKRYTFAKAIDVIERLLACDSGSQPKEFSRFHVLAVDDDKFARTMMGRTLDRANLSYVTTGRPETALELLKENGFDLAILDVEMEGMSGFELCTALRNTERNRQCPVIFVTVRSDFHSKMVSLQSGGKDFIVKPFAPMELALKALVYMIGAQLGQDSVEEARHPKPKAVEEFNAEGLEILE